MRIHPLSNGRAYKLGFARAVFEFFFVPDDGKIRKEAIAYSFPDGSVKREYFTFRALALDLILRPIHELKVLSQIFIELFRDPAFARMGAIAVDTTGGAGLAEAGNSTYSFSYTCTGSNRFLIVGTWAGGNPSATASYNSVSMTATAALNNAGTGYHSNFTLAAPASGANTLAVVHTTGIYVVVASYTGVDQTTPYDGLVTQTTGTAATETNTVTTSVDNSWLVGTVVEMSAATGFTAGANTTLRTSQGTAMLSITDSNAAKTPTGNYSLSWTIVSGTPSWIDAVFALRPLSGTTYTPTYTETVTTTDTVLKATTRILSETVTATDTIIRSIVRIISETVTVADTMVKSTARTLTESFSVTDTIKKIVNGIITIWRGDLMHTTSFSGDTKHSTSFTEDTKHSTIFTFEDKNG